MQFRLNVEGRVVGFSLPVNWRKFQQVLKNEEQARKSRRGGARADRIRWDDEEYVYRVSWRNIRDWVLALYETQIVELPQVFLPFATSKSGKTLY